MKYVVICGDGMGDYPVAELGGRTILQTAATPHLRRLAAAGRLAMVRTVPDELPPGSDVANLGLLGYDARQNYTGRAPIEAAGAGLPLRDQDVAYRCNLVHVRDGAMTDYSAGHITTPEAHQIITDLDRALGRPGLRFHGGVSYRHLLVWENGPVGLQTQPPHDIADQPVAGHLPAGPRSDEVRDLMARSEALLRDHPVNRQRRHDGLLPATQIWLWGQGKAMTLEPYRQKFGLAGGVISAVDLVRGLGVLAGLVAPKIVGATGFLDTNYEGKVTAALKILERDDFVYVHIEAPDECGHLGSARKKQQAVEDLDARVIGPLWQALEKRGQPYRLIIGMDHRTPVAVRGHTREPVPILAVDGPTGPLSRETAFDETIDAPAADAWDWISAQLRKT